MARNKKSKKFLVGIIAFVVTAIITTIVIIIRKPLTQGQGDDTNE
jgi:hypothetical protein